MSAEIAIVQPLAYHKPSGSARPDLWKYSGVVLRISQDRDHPQVEVYELPFDEPGLNFHTEAEPTEEMLKEAAASFIKDKKPVATIRLPRNLFWEPNQVIQLKEHPGAKAGEGKRA